LVTLENRLRKFNLNLSGQDTSPLKTNIRNISNIKISRPNTEVSGQNSQLFIKSNDRTVGMLNRLETVFSDSRTPTSHLTTKLAGLSYDQIGVEGAIREVDSENTPKETLPKSPESEKPSPINLEPRLLKDRKDPNIPTHLFKTS